MGNYKRQPFATGNHHVERKNKRQILKLSCGCNIASVYLGDLKVLDDDYSAPRTGCRRACRRMSLGKDERGCLEEMFDLRPDPFGTVLEFMRRLCDVSRTLRGTMGGSHVLPLLCRVQSVGCPCQPHQKGGQYIFALAPLLKIERACLEQDVRTTFMVN